MPVDLNQLPVIDCIYVLSSRVFHLGPCEVCDFVAHFHYTLSSNSKVNKAEFADRERGRATALAVHLF